MNEREGMQYDQVQQRPIERESSSRCGYEVALDNQLKMLDVLPHTTPRAAMTRRTLYLSGVNEMSRRVQEYWSRRC